MNAAARVLTGVAISGAVSVLALRLSALRASGAWAALVLGAVLFIFGGWNWLALTGVFFATSSALTRCRPRSPDAAVSGDAGGRRWDQVLANGGVAALAAMIHRASDSPLPFVAAAGALAAATADTWATEIGRWSARPPRLITTRAVVPHGTSGGMTALGTAGAAGGAAVIAAVAAGLVVKPIGPGVWPAVLAAGFSGAVVDSLLGATLETRYAWIGNSLVNLAATMWGACAAVALLLGVSPH